ncbi:MAG TPA: glycosyltransferase family 9 protein [Candidatus Eisenbacteria bacterium]
MRAPEARPALPAGWARRVLVIRHRTGGDLLLATPALRALREGLPDAAIEVLTARGFQELLLGNPDVDAVLTFDRRSIFSQAALYARLLRGGYDAVLDFVSNPRSALLTALTRASVRVGYDLPGRAWAYTIRVPREPLGPGGPTLRYAPEAALDQVRALGVAAGNAALRFFVAPGPAARMDGWLRSEGIRPERPLVLCLPAGSWPAKTWPAERFSAVMDALAVRDGAEVIWLWGPGERELAARCRDAMRGPSRLAPPTGWQELGALVACASLFVGNDSGPKHVAVALGVPTVTVFGPTHPDTWHPPAGPHRVVEAAGLACLHCNANVCPLSGQAHMRCMLDVTVEAVTEAARAALGPHAARSARAGETSCASR